MQYCRLPRPARPRGHRRPVVETLEPRLVLSPLFFDDFNADSSSDYTIAATSPDTAATFALDYGTLGIPAAPNTTDATTIGLKLQANMADDPGTDAVEAITLHTLDQFSGDFTVGFDMWMNANGPFPDGGTGSTEFLTAGVGGDGVTAHLGGTAGSGAWTAVSGEGGSSRDYRLYKAANEQSPSTGQFAAGTTTGANNHNHPYYSGFGGINVTALPVQGGGSQTGTTFVGTVGFAWHEIELIVDADGGTGAAPSVRWRIDGTVIGTLDAGNGTSFVSAGRVTIGYMDVFSSVSDNATYSFAVIDNLRVTDGAAAPDIILDADFDHGSLNEAVSFVAGTNVFLVGRDNFYGGGQWRWVHFKASNVDGMRPIFQISDNFAGGGSALNNHKMVYSYDGEQWAFFDNNVRDSGQSTYTFSNNSPFTHDDVFVAYSLAYSYQRSVDLVTEIKASPWVMPTASADSNLVIGQSPGGVDDLGRTIAPRDVFGFKITDPGSSVPKTRITVATGLHAGEVLGRHTAEAFIRFLVGTDPRAAALRNVAEFYVYPTLNPDGVFAGYNRSTVQNPNQDPNRFWSPDDPTNNWQDKPDLKLNGEAMMLDLDVANGGETDYFMDIHSTIPFSPARDYGYIELEKNHDQDPFWVNLLALDPSIGTVDSTSTGPTTANFGDWTLGADFDLTFETMFLPGRNLDHYQNLGTNFGLSFYEALANMPGDMNFDGEVNGADVDLFVDVLLNGPFSIAADMNEDSLVNGLDLDPFMALVAGGRISAAAVEQQSLSGPERSGGVNAAEVVVTAVSPTPLAGHLIGVGAEFPHEHWLRVRAERSGASRSGDPSLAGAERALWRPSRARRAPGLYEDGDRARRIHRSAVARIFADQMRAATPFDDHGRRPSPDAMQPAVAGGWQAAVDRVFQKDAVC